MRDFNVETTRRTQAINVTAEVQEALAAAPPDAAAAVVYVPHTSAGVVIQEHADPAVGTDLEMAFESMTAGPGSTWRRATSTRGRMPVLR